MMQIITCEQGSAEWLEARRGIPTASEFHCLLMKGRGEAPSKTRQTYMDKLAGEILTGECTDGFSNHHMERGKEMEPEARSFYAFMHDAEPQLAGFIRNGQKGCSPDSLIGSDGMLEIKTKLPHLQVAVLRDNEVPKEHIGQCQGNLWVAEREWIDFVSYWPKMPLFVKRIYRDEIYIKRLAEAVDAFNDELAQLVDFLRHRDDYANRSNVMTAG